MKCPYCYGTGNMPDHFGAKLKGLLEAREISVYRLSHLTGISQAVLARVITKNEHKPRDRKYAKIIAEALEVPVDELIQPDLQP